MRYIPDLSRDLYYSLLILFRLSYFLYKKISVTISFRLSWFGPSENCVLFPWKIKENKEPISTQRSLWSVDAAV